MIKIWIKQLKTQWCNLKCISRGSYWVTGWDVWEAVSETELKFSSGNSFKAPVESVTDLLYLVDGLVTCVLQAQVHHGVLQSPTHVELQGEIVDALKESRKQAANKEIYFRHEIYLLDMLENIYFALTELKGGDSSRKQTWTDSSVWAEGCGAILQTGRQLHLWFRWPSG